MRERERDLVALRGIFGKQSPHLEIEKHRPEIQTD